MSNQLVMQWLKMGDASLAAIKQLSESKFTTPAPDKGSGFEAADGARMIKASLDTMRQLNEIGTEIGTKMFLNQIKMLNSGVTSEARESLTQLLDSFSGQYAQQQAKSKAGIKESVSRCMANLQEAQTQDDITMVLMGFSNELNQKSKDSGGELFGLLNSANAASSVWINQTLDQVIASGEPAVAAESGA